MEQIRQCIGVRTLHSDLLIGSKSPSCGHMLCHPDSRYGLTPVTGGAGGGQPT